ncbi:MAG: Asp-tRNA(Asn)/Glu-tRNA(Gln) amidotransferase subunit GatC [Calditrichaeota bacterium]|nr:MAG: Asp-tRNA(Asn)/Glu-tRNA(Gln) amidotransferase subunit GatC [Calditrichota bacterium]
MAISLEEVKHLARLAKLEFSDPEYQQFTEEMNRILAYVEKLRELDTSDVEPLSHTTPLSNVMREDEVKPSLPVEEALRNAPDRKGNFFKVPKVIK